MIGRVLALAAVLVAAAGCGDVPVPTFTDAAVQERAAASQRVLLSDPPRGPVVPLLAELRIHGRYELSPSSAERSAMAELLAAHPGPAVPNAERPGWYR